MHATWWHARNRDFCWCHVASAHVHSLGIYIGQFSAHCRFPNVCRIDGKEHGYTAQSNRPKICDFSVIFQLASSLVQQDTLERYTVPFSCFRSMHDVLTMFTQRWTTAHHSRIMKVVLHLAKMCTHSLFSPPNLNTQPIFLCFASRLKATSPKNVCTGNPLPELPNTTVQHDNRFAFCQPARRIQFVLGSTSSTPSLLCTH